MDEDFCQTVHFLLRTHLSIIARKRENLDSPGFTTGKLISTMHRQLVSRLVDLETITSTQISNGDLHESLNAIQESCTLATLSALSLSSELSAVNHDKKTFGKNITSFFRPKQHRSKKEHHETSAISSNGHFPSSYHTSSKAIVSPSLIPHPAASKGPKSILKKGPNPQNLTSNESVGVIEVPPLSVLLDNMNSFLSSLEGLCTIVEKALLKSFSQKLTEWSLQPWSSRKDKALAEATVEMRKGLVILDEADNSNDSSLKGKWSPIMSPTNSSEYLVSIDSEKCYILPTAHFPILLSFRAVLPELSIDHGIGLSIDSLCSIDASYGVKVDFLSVRDSLAISGTLANTSYIVHAAIAGIIQKTEKW